MRILVAIIAGVLLATGSSVAIVNAATAKPDPRPLNIYPYGQR
ncbi:hypothetical protein GCM10022221_55710 [Actinocorallia aurea]|uniref:Uncharacterized protein n=1 Tax=Actinocorallia herbida TaxID=58109 RepID=A0A3N1D8W2_9ACTN|nr:MULTISPECIES: hypothetical protein [Actinocorallia]MDX6743817.1 hypothetical protein [Actinocorallia sp. A-T 12471]ROO89931.1 hypothetical protein EDD29_7641 [Actinocorallia herbida]